MAFRELVSIERVFLADVKPWVTSARADWLGCGGVNQQVNVMINNTSEVRVLKLKETHPEEIDRASDAQTMFRIWSLLGGQAQMRDRTICNRVLG